MRRAAASPAPPRIAIVSDTMVRCGGAERVVEAIAEAFPQAPIHCVLYDPRRGPRSIESRVVQSWLHRIPGARRIAKALVPLYSSAIESFDLRGYDVIISSHHTLAKGILRSTDQTHICYCHTPMRSLWELPHDELRRAPALARPLVRYLLAGLRNWRFSKAAGGARISRPRADPRRVFGPAAPVCLEAMMFGVELRTVAKFLDTAADCSGVGNWSRARSTTRMSEPPGSAGSNRGASVQDD